MGTISEDNLNVKEYFFVSKINKPSTFRRAKYISNFAFPKSKKCKILLVGCGVGLFLEYLVSHSTSHLLIGVDIDKEILSFANQIANKYKNLFFVQNNDTSLPFKSYSFDFVISDTSLHHYEKPLKMITEMFRVAKLNGSIIISDIDSGSLLTKLFICYYKIKSLLGISNKYDFALYNSIKHSYNTSELKLFLKRKNFRYNFGRNGICFVILIKRN